MSRLLASLPALLVPALLVLTVAGACGEELAPDVVDEPPPPPETLPPASAEELFSTDHLPRFDIELDEEAWAALEAEPKEWVLGYFTHEEERLTVGVRLKGNHSFRPLDDKPAFKIKFNEYVSGQRFLGLEGLTLNNMVIDRSMLREWISYRVFRELGVPAPRVGYAQVWVNEAPYGLYLDLEPYDDEFLERVYDDPSGNLYESEQGSDVHNDIWLWDQDEGADKTRDDLLALSQLVTLEGNEVFYGEQALIDMPHFLAFLAGESIVGHFDGHMGSHNFFIYHEPTQDRWSYQPWSLDQTLARHVDPFDQEGYLGAKCLHDAQCLVDYVETAQQAVDALAAMDFEAEVEQVIELTDAAMREDPRRPYTEEDVEAGRESSLAYITGRAAELEPQFDCLVDGQEPDADVDGFGPCFEDCNEDDPAINPAAPELCDGIDNDCSGYIDDVPSCECPSVESEGQTFYLCHNVIDWYEARSFCAAQGHELAAFASATQQAEVWAVAKEIYSGRWAIGLNDRDTEETYLWLDGSAPSYETWADGEPSHQLAWFDCVFLAGSGVWYERNCIQEAAFMCSASE